MSELYGIPRDATGIKCDCGGYAEEVECMEEEIYSAAPDMDRQSVRNICGAMLFSGDEALKFCLDYLKSHP